MQIATLRLLFHTPVKILLRELVGESDVPALQLRLERFDPIEMRLTADVFADAVLQTNVI